MLDDSKLDCARIIAGNLAAASMSGTGRLRGPGSDLAVGAVDRACPLHESLVDAAGPEVGREAGEPERDPHVVEVLRGDPELDQPAALSECDPLPQVRERLGAGAREELAAVRFLRRVDLEQA